MGILDRYTTAEDTEELARNLKLNLDKKNIQDNRETMPISSKKKRNKNLKTSHAAELDEGVVNIVQEFTDNYKNNHKTSRMIRIQDDQYRILVGLRADGISVSEFISFAVHFVLKSDDFENFINILKK